MYRFLILFPMFIWGSNSLSQDLSDELHLRFNFLSGDLGNQSYAQGDIYFDYYFSEKACVSWGIGTGFRDNMRFQHFHAPLGPIIGGKGFVCMLTPTEVTYYPGGYDQYGLPDEYGLYDSYGFYVGTEVVEERESFASALLVGVLLSLIPEQIGVDLDFSKRLKLHPYIRPLGMHVARVESREKARVLYNYGVGTSLSIMSLNSHAKLSFTTEFMGVTQLGNGMFFGGSLSFPL